MSLGLLACSICGMELSEDQVMASRTVAHPASEDLVSVCGPCDDFYDERVTGNLLAFLATS